MLDIGWSELFVIGIVALVVIGPKDLPVMFRTLGRFTAKARNMARDFQRAMDSAADQTGVKDVARDLRSVTSAKSMGLDAMQNAAARFEKWDPLKRPAPMATGAGVGAAAAAARASAATEPPAAAPAAGVVPVVPVVPPAHGPATAALIAKRSADSAAIAARVDQSILNPYSGTPPTVGPPAPVSETGVRAGASDHAPVATDHVNGTAHPIAAATPKRRKSPQLPKDGVQPAKTKRMPATAVEAVSAIGGDLTAPKARSPKARSGPTDATKDAVIRARGKGDA